MADYRFANDYVKKQSGSACNFPDIWDLCRLRMITSDKVAAKLLDMAEMFGYREAIKMLQEAMNQPLEEADEHFTVNGHMTRSIADAIQAELRFTGGEFAFLSALVSACEEKINEMPGLTPEQKKLKLQRAEQLP